MSNRLRVLVVDDNRDVADCLALLLTHLGHEVRPAYGATQARAEIDSFQPQAAFLDLALPGTDGYALARQVRSAVPKVFLVAYTGYQGLEEKVRQAGFDEYLLKPCSVTTLTTVLDRAQRKACA